MAANNRQKGSFLIEFILVAAMVLIVAVWGSSELAKKAKTLQAQSLANWMLMAQTGLQNYIDKNYTAILSAIDAHGLEAFNQSLKPSWHELKQGNYINQAWNISGPARQNLDYLFGVSGNCQEKNCRLQALTYTNKAVLDKSGNPDTSFIADWLLAANGQGMVYRKNKFVGAGVSFDMAAGIFLNGMLALAAEKNIFAVIDGGGAGQDENPDHAPGDSQQQIDTDNFLVLKDNRNPDFQGNLNVLGSIQSKSYLQSERGLVLKNTTSINQSCTIENEITLNSSYPFLLVCKNKVRQAMSYPFAGAYMINSEFGCRNSRGASTANPVTGTCDCPHGYLRTQISESGSLADRNGLSTGYICLIK